MGLETGTYIADLNTANPSGADPKSQGDDHIRLLKSTIKATFPNIAGAVAPTHVELNYVDGVASPIQTQIDSKGAHAGQAWTGAHDFTGAAVAIPTASPGDADTTAASTGFVDASFGKIAGQTWTGTHSFTGATTRVATAAPGTNDTTAASTAFATQLSFQAALPVQSGADGKWLRTSGAAASWNHLLGPTTSKSADYAVQLGDYYKDFVLSGSHTLALPMAASAGDGFMVMIHNAGAGVWTVDPIGAELVDGRTTILVYPDERFLLRCDGAGWRSIGRASKVKVASVTAAASASLDFEALFSDTEFVSVEFVLKKIVHSNLLAARFKHGGSYLSSNYYSGSSTFSGYVPIGNGPPITGRIALDNIRTAAALCPALSGAVQSGSEASAVGGAQNGSSALIEGFQLIASSGTIASGTVDAYGVRA